MEPDLANRPPERGLLIILSAPSGAGKTTLARRLMAEFGSMEFSVSYTTRAPRGQECDGIDYHFVDRPTFEHMIAADELAEWALVHGNHYGTARHTVEAALASGRDVVFDIDWQGAESLAEKWPDDTLRVFILPPDLTSLSARLRGRGTDSDQVIEQRLAKAVDEMRHQREFDYTIVNDDLERAYGILRAAYLVRRYGKEPRPGVPHPLDQLARMLEDIAPQESRRAEALLGPS